MIIDLTSTTFLIPILVDSFDRTRNLFTLLAFLNKHAKTNVCINELAHPALQSRDKHNGGYDPLKDEPAYPFSAQFTDKQDQYPNLSIDYTRTPPREDGMMHRTRQINYMAACRAKTPAIVIYDTDVIISPHALLAMQQCLLDADPPFDICYPFNTPDIHVPKTMHGQFGQELNITILNTNCSTPLHNFILVGMAIGVRRDWFIKNGGFPDHFISWGSEDEEFADRAARLNARISRVRSPAFHLEHDRGVNSSADNPYRYKNLQRHHEMRAMDANAFANYMVTNKTAMVCGIRHTYGETVLPC